jgi:hypothetical protein
MERHMAIDALQWYSFTETDDRREPVIPEYKAQEPVWVVEKPIEAVSKGSKPGKAGFAELAVSHPPPADTRNSWRALSICDGPSRQIVA